MQCPLIGGSRAQDAPAEFGAFLAIIGPFNPGAAWVLAPFGLIAVGHAAALYPNGLNRLFIETHESSFFGEIGAQSNPWIVVASLAPRKAN